MILDYLRRVSHLRLFGVVEITQLNRDPAIEWNTDYEKHWRDECTEKLTVPNVDQERSEGYVTPPPQPTTPPTIYFDKSETEESLLKRNDTTHESTSTTADSLDHIEKASEPLPSRISASKHPCIFVQPTAYQKQACDQAVVGTESTLLFNSKNQFERLLNILSHPDSEVIHHNDIQLSSQNEKSLESGKTALLFALLKRLALLDKDLDIAIITNDHDTESVIYQILRFHGYQCQRIPVILENNWSNEHGVFFTTSEASYTKWSTRPSIDIIFMFDIRISNDILSKTDGEKRIMWIINKDTVEERAFSILQRESGSVKWQDIWRQSEALRNTINQANQWDTSLSFEESIQKSADQAFDVLFPSTNKRPRSPQAKLNAPPPKRKASIVILDSSDSDDEHDIMIEEPSSLIIEKSPSTVAVPLSPIIEDQPVIVPAEPRHIPLDVNHFEIRTIEVVDNLLGFPEILDLSRKQKDVAKSAILSREFKETATDPEKALYTSLQPRLEDIEARFQHEYHELTENLQRQYTEWMFALQRKYRKEALDTLDAAVANRDKKHIRPN